MAARARYTAPAAPGALQRTLVRHCPGRRRHRFPGPPLRDSTPQSRSPPKPAHRLCLRACPGADGVRVLRLDMRLLAGAGLAGSCRRPRSLWPGCWHPVPFALAPLITLPAPGSPHGLRCRNDSGATAPASGAVGTTATPVPRPGRTFWAISGAVAYPAPAGHLRRLRRFACTGRPRPARFTAFPQVFSMAIDFTLRLPLALARTVASRRNLPIRFAYGARVQQDGVRALEPNLCLLA